MIPDVISPAVAVAACVEGSIVVGHQLVQPRRPMAGVKSKVYYGNSQITPKSGSSPSASLFLLTEPATQGLRMVMMLIIAATVIIISCGKYALSIVAESVGSDIVDTLHVLLHKETGLHHLFQGILFKDRLVDDGLFQIVQEHLCPRCNVGLCILTRVVAEVGRLAKHTGHNHHCQ